MCAWLMLLKLCNSTDNPCHKNRKLFRLSKREKAYLGHCNSQTSSAIP